MEKILMLLAVAFFVAAIIVGSVADNTWRNTGITWVLLAVGCVSMGILFTL